MRVGCSSSCFYPLETEKALDKVLQLGFKSAEIFVNTASELALPFVAEMKQKADAQNCQILAVHPFSAAIENTCIFGEYPRRYADYIGLYQQHCHAAAVLGADIVVIHGALETRKIPLADEDYFQRFRALVEIGRQEGVRVCQENVVRFKSQSPAFLQEMHQALGDDFHMVFDVKQAIRAGYEPLAMAEMFKEHIVHVHLSDNTPSQDCLPPGKGSFDFAGLFSVLQSAQYAGGYVIEIYSNGCDVEAELRRSQQFFEELSLS